MHSESRVIGYVGRSATFELRKFSKAIHCVSRKILIESKLSKSNVIEHSLNFNFNFFKLKISNH